VEEVEGDPNRPLREDDEGLDLTDRCWFDQREQCWMTDFPPPHGFDGYESRDYDEIGDEEPYERACTPVEVEILEAENARARAEGKTPARGDAVNPVYFPPPHAVVQALYTAFVTPPRLPSEPWLHQSLWHSIQVIFWGFLISSIFGVPLGILCGAFPFFSRLSEPFIEFFRYLPAPAFGALCVAILGIDDAPKVAIIVIGTFFQQVLVIANTTRKLDVALVEAALTLGAKNGQLLRRVVLPGILPDLYRDQRILLGWAWTYLIVAELIGTMSGITYFITQQARYQHFPNVYAAIMMIGIIGVGTDIVLGLFGRWFFPWDRSLVKQE